MTAGVAVSRASKSTQTAYGSADGATAPVRPSRSGRPLLLPSPGTRVRRKRCTTRDDDAACERWAHGGKEQLGNRGRAHRGGARRGRLPRLPGVGERPGRPRRKSAAARPRASAAESKPPASRTDEGPARAARRTPARASGSSTRWTTPGVAGGRERARPRAPSRSRPSTVNPPPGTYEVTSRSGAVTGSDGIPIEHVVRFANVERRRRSASAPRVDGSMPSPDPHEEDRRRPDEARRTATRCGTSRRSARRSSSSRRPVRRGAFLRGRGGGQPGPASRSPARGPRPRRPRPVARRGGDRGGRRAGGQQVLHRQGGRRRLAAAAAPHARASAWMPPGGSGGGRG